MKITDDMQKFIEMAMDEELDKAYPKSDKSAEFRGKVKFETFKSLERQKESILSRALFFATSQLTPVAADLAVCTCGEKHYQTETECHQCGLPIPPIR